MSATYPPLILSKCTEALAPTAVDMRGLWLEPNGTPAERIEQCGQRIIIVGAGVVHDTLIADGTLHNGVNDISYTDCSPINVGGRFFTSNQTFVFYDSNGAALVTRQKISATTLQLIHPVAGIKSYTLATAPTPSPPASPKTGCLNWNVTRLPKTKFIGPRSKALPSMTFPSCADKCKIDAACLSFSFQTVGSSGICSMYPIDHNKLKTTADGVMTSGYLTCTSWSS